MPVAGHQDFSLIGCGFDNLADSDKILGTHQIKEESHPLKKHGNIPL
jgi:hypothetical protein